MPSKIQSKRNHRLGRKGERLVAKQLGLKRTRHTAPFDLVDTGLGYAYEVKTVSKYSTKIHISDKSFERKRVYAEANQLQMMLVIVIINTPEDINTITMPLTQQHIYINRSLK